MELLAHEPEYALEEEYRLALITAQHEREYDQAHARTVQLVDAERDRMQCMQRLLLQMEIENLQSELNQTSQELTRAREAESDARIQLHSSRRELDRLQSVVQVSSRELESLRCELATLNSVASDSQKDQAEKVRLAKEVSNIQSEVERLRSQNTSAKANLAEKQALSRQLNELEVQLENEKRAHERTLVKGSQQTEKIATLTLKLEEARRELELARRQRQTIAPQKSRGPTAHQASVSDRSQGGNIKQEVGTDSHEEVPLESEKQRSAVKTKGSSERPSGTPLQNLTSRLHPELTIATPGAVRAQAQQKRFSTLPGEKSSFSITPFLNRTSGLEDSPASSDDELNELQSVGDDSQLPDLSGRSAHGEITTTHVKQPKPSASRQPNKPGKQGLTKAGINGEMASMQKPNLLGSPDEILCSNPFSRPTGQKQAQNKKRKLGLQRERSLFDEDEDETTLQDVRKPGRKLVGTGPSNLPSNRTFTGLAGFSPLKRDKKRP